MEKTLIHKIRETTLCIFIILKSIPEGNQIKEDLFLLTKIPGVVANRGPLKTSRRIEGSIEQLLSFLFLTHFPKHMHFEPLRLHQQDTEEICSPSSHSFYRKQL